MCLCSACVSPLTSTQSSLRVSSSPQMAAQPLDVIARFSGTAVLVELASTNFTAATVVSHPADAGLAQGGQGVAGAISWAVALCLRNRVRGQDSMSDS